MVQSVCTTKPALLISSPGIELLCQHMFSALKDRVEHAHPYEHDRVDRAVQLPVTTSVQQIRGRVARRGGDRTRPSDLGQRRFGADASRIGPDGHDDRCGDVADSGHVQQRRNVFSDQCCHLLTVSLEVAVKLNDALGVTDRISSGSDNGPSDQMDRSRKVAPKGSAIHESLPARTTSSTCQRAPDQPQQTLTGDSVSLI